MSGRLIRGERYVCLMDDNDLKNKSLEDAVYFTLRDIFRNGEHEQCITANYFNHILTNGISLEERDDIFQYRNVIYDHTSNYTGTLHKWLSLLYAHRNIIFDFELPLHKEEINMDELLRYDLWLQQLQQLIEKLKEQSDKNDERAKQDEDEDM
jgi:hypothetical protein